MSATTAIAAASALWTVFSVDPYNAERYIPYTPPEGGIVTNEIGFAAALGEWESASFVILPSQNLEKVDFRPVDIRSTGPGAPAWTEDIDVRLVKVWYQAEGDWTSDRHGRINPPYPTPSMILHDHSLVRVDEDKKINYVRVDYEDGPRYVDMSSPGTLAPFPEDLHPVRDAPAFVPTDLASNRYQQVWLTLRVPPDAPDDEYVGKLLITTNNAPAGELGLRIRVNKYFLPRPRTHYDTSRPYYCGMMGAPSLAARLKGMKDFAKAEDKLRAVSKVMYEHGVLYPDGPGDFTDGSDSDLAARTLRIWQQAGMPCDTLFNSYGNDNVWYENGETPESAPEAYSNSLAQFCTKIDRQFAVAEKLLGHRRLFFFGRDEASTWGVRRQQGHWNEIRRRGGFAFATGGVAEDISWGVDCNDQAANCSYTTAAAWHAAGGLVCSYAAPFTGIECPDVWRRVKGIRLWFADYDGLNEMGWCQGRNVWNDINWRGDMYRQEKLVYPTIDGCITTLALEGLREGLDDVRYLSLHRILCDKAMASEKADVRDLGRREFAWLELKDPERVIDLRAFRAELSDRIERLIQATGFDRGTYRSETVVTVDQTPQPPPLVTETNLAKLAEMDRYDLAIPGYEAIRTNTATAEPDRIAATLAEAKLLLDLLRRPSALRIIDEELARKGLEPNSRTKLLHARANTLVTEMVFEEQFVPARIEEAEQILKRVAPLPGVTLFQKVDTAFRLVRAAIATDIPDVAIRLIDEWTETIQQTHVPHRAGWVAQLRFLRAQAWAQKKEHRKAVSDCQEALQQPLAINVRQLYMLMGAEAEAAGDYGNAQAAYIGILPLINKKEQPKEYAYYSRKLSEMTSRQSNIPKATADPFAEDMPEISLED